MKIYRGKTATQLFIQCLSIARHQTGKAIGRFLSLRYKILDALHPVVMVPIGDGKHLRYRALSRLTAARAKLTLTKEPDTTRWIAGFEEGAVFYDIGANVGVYSLLAAKTKSAQVFAFDPFPPNFINLVKNIELNDLTESVSAFCVAFTDETRIDGFYVNKSWQDAGASGNAFGAPNDQRGNAFNPHHKVSTLGISVDRFIEVFGAPGPDYMKIDVDGIELAILAGAPKTLRAPSLKAVMVELEGSRDDMVADAVALMKEAGFEVAATHRTTDNPANLSTNYLFRRA